MRIRVFISSVQKELADERLALQILLSTDPFLSEHCVPILFEDYPAPLQPDPQAYLKVLSDCHVIIVIIGRQYGRSVGGLSATHREYRLAKEKNLPTLITIRGSAKLKREEETQTFIKEIRSDGHTYDRFEDIESLQQQTRQRLIKHIRDSYDLEPTLDQEKSAHDTIHVASRFERQRLDRVPWEESDIDIASRIAAASEEGDSKLRRSEAVRKNLWLRGYLWRDDQERYYTTAAGILLFAADPSAVFVHARIQASTYSGENRTASPSDHTSIRQPISKAIDEAVAFINRNTRHPLRVVGLNRIEVDEYPEEALREALVNALAHRDYEDTARRITVEVFKDRVEITSPGTLPGNLTLTKLRSGRARSRSRNPHVAQGLSFLNLMEERGTGIQRMRDAMRNHGLDDPVLSVVDGEVVVRLPGPGDDLNRIRTPDLGAGRLNPSVEARLNARQKAILAEAVGNGSVTTGWCIQNLGVVRDTAVRDMNGLVDLGLLEPKGRGRGRHYAPKV